MLTETYHIKKFVKELAPFEESYLDSFTKIIIAYLQAKRLCISDIANSMGSILHKKGNNADKIDETNYKAIQRFLNRLSNDNFTFLGRFCRIMSLI